MGNRRSAVSSDLDEPIIFRTTTSAISQATLATGSLWLRSDHYYRTIEDTARKDDAEGFNGSKLVVPLRIASHNGPTIQIHGDGQIGQQIVPHYILSMHGSSISEDQ